MTPGTVWRTTHGSRADGMFWSSWLVMLVESGCRFGSRIGVSPDTCTCSVTPCTPSVTLERDDAAGGDGESAVQVIREPWSDAFT